MASDLVERLLFLGQDFPVCKEAATRIQELESKVEFDLGVFQSALKTAHNDALRKAAEVAIQCKDYDDLDENNPTHRGQALDEAAAAILAKVTK